jgi:hypothetical protein
LISTSIGPLALGRDGGLDRRRVGDVEGRDRDRQALHLQALQAIAPRRIAQRRVDARAGLGELLGDQQAKAAVGAGDEDIEGHRESAFGLGGMRAAER